MLAAMARVMVNVMNRVRVQVPLSIQWRGAG